MIKKYFFKKLFLVIIFFIGTLSFVFIDVNAMENMDEVTIATVKNDIIREKQNKKIYDYFTKNLDVLKNNYYNEFGILLTAEYIEYYCTVFELDGSSYATYLDFNDATGYMIVNNQNQLIAIVNRGDLKYLRKYDFVFYSQKSKFLSYDLTTSELINLDSKDDEFNVGKESISGSSEKDGQILDIDQYVKSNYPNYTYHSSYSISNYRHINQFDTSIFLMDVYENGQNITKSEGNCVLNATYSILNNWKEKGFYSNLPSYTDVVDYDYINNEPYQAYVDNGWHVNNHTVGSNFAYKKNGSMAIDNVPQLYLDVREVIYKYFKSDYLGNGVDLGENKRRIELIIDYVLNKYNYVNPKINNYGDDFSVMEAYLLLKDRAQYISVSNSNEYGNHSMACIGYKKYSYKSGWWIFQSTKYAYFIEVDSGHDINNYNNGKKVFYDPYLTKNSSETIYINID